MTDYASMSGPELLAAVRDDAHKWAEAFQQIIVAKGVPIDEGLMIGWFANAIEHAETVRHAPMTLPPETAALVEELAGWKELPGCSDDARRKIWLMHKAAAEITRLAERCAELEGALRKARGIVARSIDPKYIFIADQSLLDQIDAALDHASNPSTSAQEQEGS